MQSMESGLKPRFLTFEIRDEDAGMTIREYLMRRVGFSSKQLSRFKYRREGLMLNGEKRYVNAVLQARDVLRIRLTQGGEPVEEHPNDALRRSGEAAGEEGGTAEEALRAGYSQARDGRLQKIWAPPAAWLSERHPLRVLYEDEDILAADKPSGVVCHPSPGHFDDTLSNQVAEHLGRTGRELDVRVTGRLDRDTSGIVVFALNTETAAQLIRQRQSRRMDKIYIARVEGRFRDLSGTVDLPLRRESADSFRMTAAPDGKAARTHYRVLMEPGDGTSIVACRIEQGRTHQIRVHMMSIGHPVEGDVLYGPGASRGSGGAARNCRHSRDTEGYGPEASRVGRDPAGNCRHSGDTEGYGPEDPRGGRGPAAVLRLHAWRSRLLQPFTGEEILLEAPLPDWALGGEWETPRGWSRSDR